MPSADGATASRRRQSGQSLVEVMVASAFAGIALVAGITALDAGTIGGRQVSRQAWGLCVLRSEADAVIASPWSDSGSYPAPANVSVSLDWSSGGGNQRVQRLTVAVSNPDMPGVPLGSVPPLHVYKAWALSPASASPVDTSAVTAACATYLTGAG
jgi:hypothetical protein